MEAGKNEYETLVIDDLIDQLSSEQIRDAIVYLGSCERVKKILIQDTQLNHKTLVLLDIIATCEELRAEFLSKIFEVL
jgi:hypothetical protein